MLEFTMLRITNASMHVCTPERNRSTHQGRIQDLPKGEDHVERGAPAYSGVWRLSPQRGSGPALVMPMERSSLKLGQKVKDFKSDSSPTRPRQTASGSHDQHPLWSMGGAAAQSAHAWIRSCHSSLAFH